MFLERLEEGGREAETVETEGGIERERHNLCTVNQRKRRKSKVRKTSEKEGQREVEGKDRNGKRRKKRLIKNLIRDVRKKISKISRQTYGEAA